MSEWDGYISRWWKLNQKLIVDSDYKYEELW